MRKVLSITAMLCSLVLAACGGSSDALRGISSSTSSTTGTTGTGSGTTTTGVTKVTVVSSSATIAADGSNSATITATLSNAANNVVPNVAVTFAASAGSIVVTQATTNASGVATATLSAGSAASGTSITVTVTSGTVSGKATVTVGTAQQTISVITSVPQIPSDGTKPATITALVRNAQNQFVSGVAVTFSSTSNVGSGGGLTITQGTTDANGAATATLSAAGDQTNRTITVTASAGSESATVPVQVIGTTATLTGPASLVQNSSGTYTIALTDSGGNGIANQTVKLMSAKGNTLSATSITTNANGQQTFTLTAVNAGTDTLTATALGQQATESVVVSNQVFGFSAPAAAAQVGIGTTATVTVNWTSGGAPQTGQTVSFSTTRGLLSASSATISSAGTASVTITSSSAGPGLISATGAGVSAQVAVEFVATNPAVVNLQASPSSIVTQGQSTIIATVTDAANNLVEGATVNFLITSDSTGGSLSAASSTTNAQGQATTVYTATTTTSGLNGVEITASAGTATPGTTTLTVAGETVNLSLGTGNTVAEYSTTQYSLPYTVQAVDSAGNGVNNISVAFTVTSVAFAQGDSSYPTGGPLWLREPTTADSDADAYEGSDFCLPGYESINGINTLIPGAVANTDVASGTTTGGGFFTVNLIYPKDHSGWVVVRLTATATVSGTQNTKSATFILPGATADFQSQSVYPPGKVSPYGTDTTCLIPN